MKRVRAKGIDGTVFEGTIHHVVATDFPAPPMARVSVDTGIFKGLFLDAVEWEFLDGEDQPPRDQNPKDAHGLKKVSLSKFPAVAVAYGAHAMMDGAQKYGPYNWREKKVVASIYVDACKRHLDKWFDERERAAPDSYVHHLGHALACIAIILDAEATGNLIDDRPVKGKITAAYQEIADTIERRLQEKTK